MRAAATASVARPSWKRARRPSGIGAAATALVLLACVGGLSALVGDGAAWDAIGPVLVGSILVAVTLPFLRRHAEDEGDPWLRRLLVLALLAKLGGALLRYYVAVDLYGSQGDAFAYDRIGAGLMDGFRSGTFDLGGRAFEGTQFIEILTGIVYTLIGPSVLAGFLFFSWLGFIGLYLFYRAFSLAVPDGERRIYGRLIFFLPSLVFWPSSIGKESWMLFCLGIVAFGTARMLTGRWMRGVILTGVGLWWAALTRPHVAGMTAVAAVAALVVRPSRVGPRSRFLAKAAGVVAIGLLGVIFVRQTDQFLRRASVDPSAGLTGVLGGVAERTTTGGAQFEAPIFSSPGRAPVAFGTVLFRPLIGEAHNLPALIAALEGTFLALLSFLRLRSIVAAVRGLRRRPYVAFAVAHVVIFVIGFSAVSNFAILTRERVQLLPLYLVLLAIPASKPRARGPRPASPGRSEGRPVAAAVR